MIIFSGYFYPGGGGGGGGGGPPTPGGGGGPPIEGGGGPPIEGGGSGGLAEITFYYFSSSIGFKTVILSWSTQLDYEGYNSYGLTIGFLPITLLV